MKNNSVYKPKNNIEWFLHYLFTDLDFIKEKDKIVTEIQSLVGRDIYSLMLMLMPKQSLSDQLEERGKYKTAGVLAILQPDKPELQFDPTSHAAKIIKQIESLAIKFKVSVSTVEQGIKYSDRFPKLAMKTLPSINVEDNQVVIRLNGTMKLSDIKGVYPYVKQLQKELPDYLERNRSKVRPDLIYAIYKQRLKGLTFPQIYELYESKTLPGYNGPASIIGDDILERHYDKYKPAT